MPWVFLFGLISVVAVYESYERQKRKKPKPPPSPPPAQTAPVEPPPEPAESAEPFHRELHEVRPHPHLGGHSSQRPAFAPSPPSGPLPESPPVLKAPAPAEPMTVDPAPTPSAVAPGPSAPPPPIPSTATVPPKPPDPLESTSQEGPPPLEADLPFTFGTQMALVFPASTDLRHTTGSPSLSLGLHGNFPLGERFLLRPRLDYTVFAGHTEGASLSVYSQSIHTDVSNLALGVDWLWTPVSRWRLGVGTGVTRWNVGSTNTFASSYGSAIATGTSHTWRWSAGPVFTFAITPSLEVEGRWIHSRYGMENVPANTFSLGLVYRWGARR